MTNGLSRLLGLLPLLGLLGLLAPRPAHACSAQAPTVQVDGWSGVREVPLDGLIVMPATEIGNASWPTGTLRDAAGEAMPGEFSLIPLRSVETSSSPYGAPTSARPVLLVWRSDTPLSPGASYTMEVVHHSPYEEVESFDVVASTSSLPAATEMPAFEPPFARRLSISRGLALRCDDATDELGPGACPVCAYTDLEDRVVVSAALPEGISDPYTIHRLVPESSGVIQRSAAAWSGLEDLGVRSGALYFPVESETYCFHVESSSLLDGSTLVGPSTCLTAADVAPDPTMAGGCSVGPAAGSRLAWPILVLAGALVFWRRR